MPLSIDYRLGIDATQGMSALTSIQSKMKDVGNTARSELSQKLKTVFEVTAIEEAIRRTAEWELQISQTAKQIGISAEALQTLNVIASKTGLPSDAITSMFENIAKSRDEALKGNNDLRVSYQNLGVTLLDLQTLTKSELFGKITANIPEITKTTGMFKRQSIAAVTGNTPENFINAVTQQLNPAGGFEAYRQKQLESGAIVNEKDISEMAATWSEFIQNLNTAANEIKPAATAIVSILNVFGKALAGVTQTLSDIWKMISGFFMGDTDKLKAGFNDFVVILGSVGWGIVKSFTSALDLLAKSIYGAGYHINTLLSHLPKVLGGETYKTAAEIAKADLNELNLNPETTTVSGAAKKATDFIYENANQTSVERGEALGNVAVMIGPGGAEAIAGKVGSIAKGAVSVAKNLSNPQELIKNAIKDITKKEPVLSEGKTITFPGEPVQPGFIGPFQRVENTDAYRTRRTSELIHGTEDTALRINKEALKYAKDEYDKIVANIEAQRPGTISEMDQMDMIAHQFQNQAKWAIEKRSELINAQIDKELASKPGLGVPPILPAPKPPDNFTDLFTQTGNRDKKFMEQNFQRIRKDVNLAGSTGNRFSGLYTSIYGGLAASKNTSQGTTPGEFPPIVPNKMFAQSLGGAGGQMLKMGGVFGTGFQSRLIQLNEASVKYLADITKYMSFLASPVQGTNTNPNLPPGN